jgi:hypothetical protein
MIRVYVDHTQTKACLACCSVFCEQHAKHYPNPYPNVSVLLCHSCSEKISCDRFFFMELLFRVHRALRMPLERLPVILSRVVDLFHLYHLVVSLGGSQAVDWDCIAQNLGLTSFGVHYGTSLQICFANSLVPFEDLFSRIKWTDDKELPDSGFFVLPSCRDEELSPVRVPSPVRIKKRRNSRKSLIDGKKQKPTNRSSSSYPTRTRNQNQTLNGT